MQELVSVIIIGISLSMDTFSLSLSLGPIIHNSKYTTIVPIFVGLLHFLMPILGNYLGIRIMILLKLASNILLGIILIIIGINLIINYFNDHETDMKFNLINAIILAFSVSIDSFSVGLGISDITNNYLMASIVFAICSFSFTYLGLIIGKYSHKYVGNFATLLGIILLIVLGIYHLLT